MIIDLNVSELLTPAVTCLVSLFYSKAQNRNVCRSKDNREPQETQNVENCTCFVCVESRFSGGQAHHAE